MKFIKENKILVSALLIVILAFVLLAIPEQFAHFGPAKEGFLYNLSGYQFIFGTEIGDLPNKIVPQGLAIFVMLVVTFVGLLFSKKSSFVCMLSGLSLLVISILFFTISGAGQKVYKAFDMTNKFAYGWVPYLLGALILVAAGLVLYRTVIVMKDEIKHPTQSAKGPTYNYLHK